MSDKNNKTVFGNLTLEFLEFTEELLVSEHPFHCDHFLGQRWLPPLGNLLRSGLRHQNSQGGYESSEEEKVLKKRVRKSSFQLYAPQSNINDKLKRLRKLSDTFYDNYVEDLQDNHTPSNNTVKSVCTIKE